MTHVTEISPDIFRISTFIPDANLQFNQILVRDDEPLLFHTGLKHLFPVVRDAVSTLVDPASPTVAFSDIGLTIANSCRRSRLQSC